MRPEAKWKFIKFICLLGLLVIPPLMGTAVYQKRGEGSVTSERFVAETQRSQSIKSRASEQRRALPQDTSDLPRAWNPDGSMTDPSNWIRVSVPPHGNSAHVPNIFGGHVVWGGSGFKVYYEYSDGHSCAVGDTSPNCGDGDIVASYAHNDGETLAYASYAYARQGEK